MVHHLLPQIPHYNLQEATLAVKPVMGSYYRYHLLPPPALALPHALQSCDPLYVSPSSKPCTDEDAILRREPEASKGPIPFHLVSALVRSFSQDHFVDDTGDVVYYQKDPNFWEKVIVSVKSLESIFPLVQNVTLQVVGLTCISHSPPFKQIRVSQ